MQSIPYPDPASQGEGVKLSAARSDSTPRHMYFDGEIGEIGGDGNVNFFAIFANVLSPLLK